MQIVFVDPPDKHPAPRQRGAPQRHPWEQIAEQLRARPGEWALCLREIYVTATQITSGRTIAFQPAGSFEARTVQTHNRDEKGRPLVDLYIKYVGTPREGQQ